MLVAIEPDAGVPVRLRWDPDPGESRRRFEGTLNAMLIYMDETMGRIYKMEE